MEQKFEIKDVESLEVAYLLYKGHISGAQKEFPNIFKSIGGEIMGSPFIIYRNIDQNTKIGEFELCMPSNVSPIGYGVGKKKLPSFKALSIIHEGSYDTMDETYMRIRNYIEKNKIEITGIFWEISIKGHSPIFKGDPNKYITEIIFPLVER